MAFLSHKIELDPTVKQRVYFAKACGVARFAYNWALEEWNRQYNGGGKPSWISLNRQFNAWKVIQAPWVCDVTCRAAHYAIETLGTAFVNFFRGRARHPQFKKKYVHDSFRADYGGKKDAIKIEGRYVVLPKIGKIRMKEKLRFSGSIYHVAVSRVANRWFMSVSVKTVVIPIVAENQGTVGVDLGVKAMATCSDGTVYLGPNALRKSLRKLKRLQRIASRRQNGSANRKKANARVAKLHYSISCCRKDALHKMTTDIVRRYQNIVIEDLSVVGMLKDHCVARLVSDVGMREARRQLEYKSEPHGRNLVVADRWFPSSKKCSDCGSVLLVLARNVRKWTCPTCGAVHDRDLNAAINLADYVRPVRPELTPVETGDQEEVRPLPVLVAEAGNSTFGLSGPTE